MSEPQVWTLIAVFAAAMFGMITIVSTLFVHVVRTEISGVRTEMRSELGALHQRIDSLDRDVQALMKHAFGIDRD